MKIVCVSGGSYKSFYLNYYVNLKSCDLLIFNYGIIYDIDFSNKKCVGVISGASTPQIIMDDVAEYFRRVYNAEILMWK